MHAPPARMSMLAAGLLHRQDGRTINHLQNIDAGRIFDNRHRGTKLWGAYLTRTELPVVKNMDLYYLGIQKEQATFNNASGEERRRFVRITEDVQSAVETVRSHLETTVQ
jgi:hypothetical protein